MTLPVLLDQVSDRLVAFEKEMLEKYVPVPVWVDWVVTFDENEDNDLGSSFHLNRDDVSAVIGFEKIDGRWRVCFIEMDCVDETLESEMAHVTSWTPMAELPLALRLKLLEGNPLKELELMLIERQQQLAERAKRVLRDLG
ncbi:hypothetical protein [Mariniblastus fucicola]|uniref:Uncharacterized protein n=2 Tax=Mariniblastus fucicola TaxID=980251 RepID=A0A5B9P509_9BACT|nr:hypothetical protein [Mariniblastus fucicola]QEG21488.1 hypothetical protein MFFC18_13440 [Mariniblastus fucicola]